MSEWLEFREEKPNKKTKVFTVWSKCSDCYLGEIKWYPQWRHYCHVIELSKIELATRSLIFTGRCDIEIGEFVDKLNNDHKDSKGERQ